jgi:sulfide:quinone oxidoreductase
MATLFRPAPARSSASAPKTLWVFRSQSVAGADVAGSGEHNHRRMDERPSYAICWRVSAGPINVGKLELHDGHLELVGRAPDETEAALSIAIEEVVRLQIGRAPGERIRDLPAVVLDRVGGDSVHIASPFGFGNVQEIAAVVSTLRQPAHRSAGPLEVVIAGGGVAALETMVALRRLAEERVAITLVSASERFVYRPLSVAQAFGGAPLEFELARLVEDCGARLVQAEVAAVDTGAKSVITPRGDSIAYGALVVATGARPQPALPGADTFWGRGGDAEFASVLNQLEAGALDHVVFAVPGGVVWSLPLYELALMTAARLASAGIRGSRITFVTPEDAPLALFERPAGEAIAELLANRGIELITGSVPVGFAGGVLELAPKAALRADRVVAVPQLVGSAPAGLPADASGFLPVDQYSHVRGCPGVFAAGDVTTFPVKQGGVATQQADAAADAIAAHSGAPIQPAPFRPVLRGLVLTGGAPLYLRTDVAGGRGSTGAVAETPLWWPPGKIAGRYLGPYLAERAQFSPANLSGTRAR